MKEKTPNKTTAINKAKEIIRDLLMEEPSHIDIEAIAYKREAIIKEEPMKGADGRLAIYGSQGLITVRDDIPEQGRKRFVMAHELGHYELHRTIVPHFLCSEDDFLKWNADNQHLEVEANYFAAEILMPEDIFRKLASGKAFSIELIETLRKLFSVSLTASAIRFVTLRPEYALICSSADRIKWFIVDRECFPLYLNISGKVHQESMAYEYFQGRTLPQRFLPVEPEAWTNCKVRGKLMELVIPLRRYNQVLSILHIEEEWDD